eukprot:TRINITY_DN32171_c0_g1_i1.p2 TRINITY_DN32171_c0_g1~~TRINITY_DN32171_c0_g1_i1.p2  ORF type:complete len:192 (+),score=44.50 TRINITY_DN32171_c0_g1_i1:95-670(+)
MIRRPPRSTLSSSSAASDVYKRQIVDWAPWPESHDGPPSGVKSIGRVFLMAWDSFDAAVDMMHEFNPRRDRANIKSRLEQQLMQREEDGKWVWATDPAIMTSAQLRAKEPASVMWDAVASVPCPTLMVRGELSDVVDMAQAARLARTLPEGKLVTIQGAGHSVVGDQPERFASAVVPFLLNTVGQQRKSGL